MATPSSIGATAPRSATSIANRRKGRGLALLRTSVALLLTAIAGTGTANAQDASAKLTSGGAFYAQSLVVSAEPKTAEQLQLLWRESNVLTPHDPALVPHTLVVTQARVAVLQAAGVAVSIRGSAQDFVNASYARLERHSYGRPALYGPLGGWFDTVQDLAAIDAYLDELAAKSNGRAMVVSLGESWQGRDIKALVVSSNPLDPRRKAIISTFTHHPREWLSPMVGMGIADGLVSQYASDADVKKVVDNLVVYVVPVLNPDGYVSTFNGERLRRTNHSPACTEGVDLNRNYPTGFGNHVASDCGGETYPGAAPFSEKETQAVKALAESFGKARLGWYVDYHSNAAQVMIPYAFTEAKPDNYAKNKLWGELLGEAINLPARPGFELAKGAGGGALDWFCEQFTQSLVVELPGDGFDPPPNGIAANVEQQWKGWLKVATALASENLVSVTDGGGGSGGAATAGGNAGSNAGGSVSGGMTFGGASGTSTTGAGDAGQSASGAAPMQGGVASTTGGAPIGVEVGGTPGNPGGALAGSTAQLSGGEAAGCTCGTTRRSSSTAFGLVVFGLALLSRRRAA